MEDSTDFSISRNFQNQLIYSINHSHEQKFFSTLWKLGIEEGISSNLAKYYSNEHFLSFFLRPLNSNFNFKIVKRISTNIFDEFSCKSNFINNLLSHEKLGINFEYTKQTENSITGIFLEGAKIFMGPWFSKLTLQSILRFPFSKFSLTFDHYLGKIFSKSQLPINDKFFLSNELGFNDIGHYEPTAKDSPGRIMKGDDIGSNSVFAQTIRMRLLNIPKLHNYGFTPEIYSRLTFYPKYYESTFLETIKKNVKMSYGIGCSFSLSRIISLFIYTNIANFGSNRKDDEKFGISFTVNIL